LNEERTQDKNEPRKPEDTETKSKKKEFVEPNSWKNNKDRRKFELLSQLKYYLIFD
jgi:hypothetical protein